MVGPIELGKAEWYLGDRIGQGGFGTVYEASSDLANIAVAKLIPKDPGAARELLFDDLPEQAQNIIPILDKGEWGEFLVLVMPRADISLREQLEGCCEGLPLDEATRVLSDVANALRGLEPRVVHRDLKPDNVLLYNGSWCISDFGIARYVEAATATETHKYRMTAPYAAPEQWRFEHAESATDIYAFGVMAYEIIEDVWPFHGPSRADFRRQHLEQVPPELSDVPTPLATLVAECLRKPPGSRPRPEQILSRLEASRQSPSATDSRLESLQSELVAKQSEEEAEASAREDEKERRAALFDTARESLTAIVDALRSRIQEHAPAAHVTGKDAELDVRISGAILRIETVKRDPIDALALPNYEPPFDVVAHTEIIAIPDGERARGRSHSLWYCDAQEADVYRWYELAFMMSGLVRQQPGLQPFALEPSGRDAAYPFASVTHTHQLDWDPEPFDQGSELQFIDRWIDWLVDAAQGKSLHPRIMPEHSCLL